jgi:hypothetical protein
MASSLKFTIFLALLVLLWHPPTSQPSSTHHTGWDSQRCCSGFGLGNWWRKVTEYESALTSINCMAILYSSYRTGQQRDCSGFGLGNWWRNWWDMSLDRKRTGRGNWTTAHCLRSHLQLCFYTVRFQSLNAFWPQDCNWEHCWRTQT